MRYVLIQIKGYIGNIIKNDSKCDQKQHEIVIEATGIHYDHFLLVISINHSLVIHSKCHNFSSIMNFHLNLFYKTFIIHQLFWLILCQFVMNWKICNKKSIIIRLLLDYYIQKLQRIIN